MKQILRTTALIAVLMPGAALAGDAAEGAEIAAENCAHCHDIAAGGAFKTYPPSFASIGTYRAEDQIRSRIWFPALHTPMPPGTYLLNNDMVDDLVAYIMSLDGTAQ